MKKLKEKFKYTKAIEKNDGIKTLRIEEVENGFVVEITKESHGENYDYSCKKYITSTNPLGENVKESSSMLNEIEHLL
jgi:hypothetical protein